MLEIIFLVRFGRSLAAICRAKDRSVMWAAMGVASWIVGEVIGAIAGAVMNLGPLSYVTALGTAAACATVAWFVVKNLEDHRAAFQMESDGAAAPSGKPMAGTNAAIRR